MRVFTAACLFFGLTLAVGCAHHGRSSARNADARPLPQPPLRLILGHLREHGFPSAGEAPVFVLSHWMMYSSIENAEEPDKPRFEGAPLHEGKARIFLTVGPVYRGLKRIAPPDQDLVVPSPATDAGSGGTTLMLANQTWSVGFSMKNGDDDLRQRLTSSLQAWLQSYRRFPEPVTQRPAN